MADRILVVSAPLAAQVLRLLGAEGTKPVPVRAESPNSVAADWSSVLAAGLRSGAHSPRIERSRAIQWEGDVAGTEVAGFIGLDTGANTFRVIAQKTTGVTWALRLEGAPNSSGTGGNVNIASGTGAPTPGNVTISAGATTRIACGNTGIGFFGVAQSARPNVTGSRGGNAALASLLTGLAGLGLITDNTTP